MSLRGVDPIRDCRPFKRKPHLDYLGTASQGTVYNSRTPITGKLHVSIVDKQNLVWPTTFYVRNFIPIHKVGIGKVLPPNGVLVTEGRLLLVVSFEHGRSMSPLEYVSQ